MTTAIDSDQHPAQTDVPKFVDQPLSVHQYASMALTLASLFCQEKGVPLLNGDGNPSDQVKAVAAALMA